MKTLPAALILEKNKLASPNPWLVLLDITLPDLTVYRFVKNTEDITYKGNLYTAINFELGKIQYKSNGEIPTVPLRVSNVTRLLQATLEATNGGVDSEAVMTVINAAHLAEDYSELELYFSVMDTEANDLWVIFTLGRPSPLRKRFPQHRTLAEGCNWEFLSRECNYGGWSADEDRELGDIVIPQNNNAGNHRYICTTPGTTGGTEPNPWNQSSGGVQADGAVVWTEDGVEPCRRNLRECQALNNSPRYGGHPGLRGGNVRLV